jgi:hypothetical protein
LGEEKGREEGYDNQGLIVNVLTPLTSKLFFCNELFKYIYLNNKGKEEIKIRPYSQLFTGMNLKINVRNHS